MENILFAKNGYISIEHLSLQNGTDYEHGRFAAEVE